MAKKTINFLKKTKATFQIMKAHSLYEEGAYYKAIDKLNSINGKCPDFKNIVPDYYILLGQLYYEIKKVELSAEIFFEALNTIENTYTLNEDEKKYLVLYVFQWLDFLSQYDPKNIKKIKIEKKYEDKDIVINPDNISNSLKTYFPLDYEREINISKILS